MPDLIDQNYPEGSKNRSYPVGHEYSDYDVKQEISNVETHKGAVRSLIDSAFPSQRTAQPVSSGSQSEAPSKGSN